MMNTTTDRTDEARRVIARLGGIQLQPAAAPKLAHAGRALWPDAEQAARAGAVPFGGSIPHLGA